MESVTDGQVELREADAIIRHETEAGTLAGTAARHCLAGLANSGLNNIGAVIEGGVGGSNEIAER